MEESTAAARFVHEIKTETLAAEFVTVTAFELKIYMLFPEEMKEVVRCYTVCQRAEAEDALVAEKDLLSALTKLADAVRAAARAEINVMMHRREKKMPWLSASLPFAAGAAYNNRPLTAVAVLACAVAYYYLPDLFLTVPKRYQLKQILVAVEALMQDFLFREVKIASGICRDAAGAAARSDTA